ncbi:hypothetical protein V5E97_36905 [Singulisphaera sp. Ch08]|uniref:Lipoprotein n=1 Tax=Singulisphaera sp. Ch08 TaxID=3120278 RepID=A0AAU7CFB6_9BACT
MTGRLLRRTFWAAIVMVSGCDSNPNGPSAPSPAGTGKDSVPASGTPKSIPLKQVGAPIGLLMHLPLAR